MPEVDPSRSAARFFKPVTTSPGGLRFFVRFGVLVGDGAAVMLCPGEFRGGDEPTSVTCVLGPTRRFRNNSSVLFIVADAETWFV